jgi:uncharacterized phage-like protein YoqJ
VVILKSCAFIGYPPDGFSFGSNEQHPLCKKIKDALLEQAKIQYLRGIRRFYIGGGPGTDMWAGEAVLSLINNPEYPGIEIVCVIPYEGHVCHWDDESTARLNRLMSVCSEKHTAGKPSDKSAFKKRYFYMADQSQIVIAVSRGDSDKHSDAEAALKYARRQKKDIIVIHPETAEVQR